MTSWFVVRQCAWCRRLELRGRWVRIPGLPLLQWRLLWPWIRIYSARHGVCPACLARIDEQAQAARRRKREAACD